MLRLEGEGMHVSDLDNVLWVLSVAGRILLLWVLFSRQLFRPFPVFTVWMLFSIASDPLFYFVYHATSVSGYAKFYFAMSLPDCLLQIGVLLEIVSNILRPVKRSLPKGALVILGVLVVLGGLIAFVLADHLSAATILSPRRQVVVDTTFSILRLTIFLGMAFFAQILGIGWKNHVLQLATGLGLYSAVSLVTELIHSHLQKGPSYTDRYIELSQASVLCYLGTLAFWCWSFARQEAERTEFSPPMQQLVLLIGRDTERLREAIVKKRA
jgi:hypothetical protein